MDSAEEQKVELAPIFYGSRKPWTKIKNESPLHIVAAHMAASGASYRKIYQELGRSEAWMTNLSRQPFFQVRVDSILKERFRALRAAQFSDRLTLATLHNDPVVRVTHAIDVLEA